MDPDSHATAIYLKDYTAPHFRLFETRLEFDLTGEKTYVRAELDIEMLEKRDLVLDGRELQLRSIAIGDDELAFGDIRVDDECLTIDANALPEGRFTLKSEVKIDPANNQALEGLYVSNGMYCTQCEAEGFRKITYYPDRPDVMSIFRVKILSDLPVTLSNGNLVEKGDGFSEWHDPWPKPAYLFALVAGELEVVEDEFTTASGRKVDLKIYVRKGDETRCDYAMDALKRSMRWDEEAYGREYDLDLFMIVAVDDFNMGAMENKGLNIFNSRLVLASPDTATDADYAAIESVIAHEYFHNWTGNRITCRDWFQLSLKEGLTVFRDQQFSAHERSEAVQRIEDVKRLRAAQFPEDAGPLSHPVRPESYEEINNFYTATIYEKGAEVIRMMRTLVGAEDYRKALDLYFERHDGQACTIEDWLQVFADVTGRDLDQFKRWYFQAGTPSIEAKTRFEEGKLVLSLTQSLPATPGQDKKKPQLIPLAYGLIGENGDEIAAGLLEFDDWAQEFHFDAPESARISLNRGFSAPIILKQSPYDAAFFARHDQDAFNRFEAVQKLGLDALAFGASPELLAETIGALAIDESLDPSYRAHLMSLPNFGAVTAARHQAGEVVDPVAISQRSNEVRRFIAAENQAGLTKLYEQTLDLNSHDIAPAAANQRALANAALGYLTAIDESAALARAQYQGAQLMTDKIAALSILTREGKGEAALADFYLAYENERLIVDKWLSIQSGFTPAKQALQLVKALSEHPCFESPTPNRWRALFGGFAMQNHEAFHAADGAGYAYYADRLIEQDQKNPQIAARMSTAYQSWRIFDEARQAMIRSELERILAHPQISKNLSEMITRQLSA